MLSFTRRTVAPSMTSFASRTYARPHATMRRLLSSSSISSISHRSILALPTLSSRPSGTIVQRVKRSPRSSIRMLHVSTPHSISSAPLPSSSSSASSTPAAVAALPSLDFDDVSLSFRVKSSPEILRSLFVFKLCSFSWLVRSARPLLSLSEAVLGRRLTHWVLKQTFFGHFCAGQTGAEVQLVVDKLGRSGLGGILDYAAEADVVAAPPPGTPASAVEAVEHRDREGIHSARTYDYAGEAECDANALVCRQCIVAAGASGTGGFAAIKLTALGKPELLEHLSKILTETKKLFVNFSTSEASSEANFSLSTSNPNPSIAVASQISLSQFRRGLEAISVRLPEEKMRKLFEKMDVDASGSIDYIEWVTFLDPRSLGGLSPKFHSSGLPTLTQAELEKVLNMIARLEGLAKLASEKGVHLMVDAEQTYFQPAIDHLVLDLQRKYNKSTPVIYNTYQCYLRDAGSRAMMDATRAQREGFKFAAKVVRGAYMIQERKRAKEHGYEDPIQSNIEETHHNYHAVVSSLLTSTPRASVLVASHNETTVRYVTALMSEIGIPRSGGGVYFGQLLGMCDHVSFSLGQCGYQVYKYVPYGPIHDVIPYLIRRAEENADMLGGATKERMLLRKELGRRIKEKLFGSK